MATPLPIPAAKNDASNARSTPVASGSPPLPACLNGDDPGGAASTQRSYARLVVVIFLAYMTIGIGLYVWRGASFTPDRWLILLLVGALVMGRALAFLRDWVPLVLLIAGYEMMRKLAYQMVDEGGRYVHVQELVDADRALFGGTLPTLWLQGKLFDPGTVHWYDYLAPVFYAIHFVFPLAFAFMLWLTRKERFWQFSLAFLLMTYAAFAFFLFYPAAPPWMADQKGLVEGVEWPFTQAFQSMVPQQYENFDTFKIWGKVSGNPVAAMPSLHASFPWLVTLFAVKFYGRRGLLFLPYNPILWFSIVYLGHHWVVDVLAGVGWATVCFAATLFLWPAVVRGFAIPLPGPLRRAGGRVKVAVASVFAPVGRARARLLGLLGGPRSRLSGRS